VTIAQTTDVGGYHPVVFSAGGTNTNVPYVVFALTGQGYIATAVADGSATNGNQRGNYAIDWQQKRLRASQIASGAYSTVLGGQSNTASGQNSCAGGSGSTASGINSLAFGNGCTAAGNSSVALGIGSDDGGAFGKLVYSGGAHSGAGQFGVTQIIANSITTATRMTSDGNAASTTKSLPIRQNHAIGGTLTVTARNLVTGDGAVWSIPVLHKNPTGTVSVSTPGIAALSPNYADSTLASATVTISADAANTGLAVTMVPPSGITLSACGVFVAAEM
jgi:hypothetical protein